MTYLESVEHILSLSNLEVGSESALRYRNLNLARVQSLLKRLGEPHVAYKSIHIAGTKGKGSTAAMIAEILRQSGMKTGLYTSPHLHTIRERVVIDGDQISEKEFADLVDEIKPQIHKVGKEDGLGVISTFEALTVLAFLYFAKNQIDMAVIEVGLGGRLDATNVVRPAVTAITSVSYDHVDVLGTSLSQIAFEKAGIIKPEIPLVCAPQKSEAFGEIERVAKINQASLTRVGVDSSWKRSTWGTDFQHASITTKKGNYVVELPLLGDHQLENATVAISIAEILSEQGIRLNQQIVQDGLKSVRWPGRMEVIANDPTVVVDGAHNQYAVGCLCRTLREEFVFSKIIAIFGASQTKAIAEMLDELAALPLSIIVANSRHPRAAQVDDVMREASALGISAGRANDIASAMGMAFDVAKKEDLILATGSLFVAAEAREYVLGIKPEIYDGKMGS